eukprot:1024857-Pyramimonas_sp.AAC.2
MLRNVLRETDEQFGWVIKVFDPSAHFVVNHASDIQAKRIGPGWLPPGFFHPVVIVRSLGPNGGTRLREPIGGGTRG